MRLPALAAACLLCACPKKEEPRPVAPKNEPAKVEPKLPESAPNAAAMPPRPDAEVEIVGTWSSTVKAAAKHVVVMQAEPCLPVPATPKRFGEMVLSEPGSLFAEFFLPQGTTASVCLYALDDAGVVVGALTMPETPKRFEGLGELMVGPHKVEVVPLPR
ncbi:MAG: hypothetical protein JNM69_42450 [Archangium sp.]|nr:hypothetical protein [Archangium sp.]